MKSYWIDSVKNKTNYSKLNQNLDVDVCIIGGGLVGISTAYNLKDKNLKTVILEKDRLGFGTSSYSTAKVTSQHGLIYKYLTDSKGKKFAASYYNANEEAKNNICNIIEKEKINCDFEYKSAYVFTQKIQEVEKIKNEVSAVNEFGGTAEFVDGSKLELKNLNVLKPIAGIKFINQAQFNPYKYLSSLANICKNSGVNIFEQTKVTNIKLQNGIYEIVTEDGYIIKSKYVVIATKFPIINIPGFYFMKMYQSTSYVIGMETETKIFDGVYISAEKPTISLRMSKENEKYLLIVAGFDNKTGETKNIEDSYKHLEEIAKKICPTGKIKYYWNTEDCITLDKIPYIGKFSELWENAYVATGFNKWGMTTSNIAADIIADKILGRKNKYEEIFKSTRVESIKNIKEVTNMVKESINGIVLKKIKIPDEEISQIQDGEGKIVVINGEKIGVYKENKNKIYTVNPICKHLGCELSWNNLDKTWDCPCHGSRYDYNGNLIYGPSIKNLE